MSSKRVIIQDKPYRNYAVGDSVLLPSRVADKKIKNGLARVFGPEDWARLQKIEKEACEARAKDKESRRAKAKKHRAENEALRPLVEAKDALAMIEKRLASAEKRLASAETPKAKKDWTATVKAIKAEQTAAKAAVAKLAPAPDPKVVVKD